MLIVSWVAPMRINNNQRVNLAGTYLVAAELALRGWVSTVTSRNAQDVDILAYSPKSGKTYGVQVKTSGENGWKTSWNVKGAKEIASPDLFYVFVSLMPSPPHDFYIVKSKDVVNKLKTAKSGWEWVDSKDLEKGKWNVLQ